MNAFLESTEYSNTVRSPKINQVFLTFDLQTFSQTPKLLEKMCHKRRLLTKKEHISTLPSHLAVPAHVQF